MSKLLLCVGCALRVAAGVLVFSALSGTVNAGQVSIAPEVDPGSMASALTLLAGGGLLLANRVRRMGQATKS